MWFFPDDEKDDVDYSHKDESESEEDSDSDDDYDGNESSDSDFGKSKSKKLPAPKGQSKQSKSPAGKPIKSVSGFVLIYLDMSISFTICLYHYGKYHVIYPASTSLIIVGCNIVKCVSIYFHNPCKHLHQCW